MAEETSFSTTDSVSLSEYIPFPFFERTVDEELEAAPLMQSSLKQFASTDEDTEEETGETAPDPLSVLRPRYRTPVQDQQEPESQKVPVPSATPLPILQQTHDVSPEGHFINNAHTCEAGTCGLGGNLFQHLGVIKRGRGYCEACGLTTCSNKTSNRWFVDGWVTFGSTMNFDWPSSKDNTPLRYNDRNADIVMNQLYLSFGRNIDKRRNNVDFGGRIDVLYGTDYFATSSLNLETRDTLPSTFPTLNPYKAVLHWNSNTGQRYDGTAALYGLSLPQAYAEMFVPFHFGTTVRAGHFYSGMSLESAMSPQNFFYSHSYSFMYGSPTTLTGFTATTQWTRQISTIFGITQGWNVFDNPQDRVNWLGGLQWQSFDKETSLSFLVHSGKESVRPGDIRTGYTLTLKQLLTRRLSYSLEHTFGYEDNAKWISIFPDERGPARWISVAQYLQWEFNNQWAFGVRGEWFRDDGHSRIFDMPLNFAESSVSGNDFFEITLGVNWKPTRFVTIRPEIRYDWSNTRIRNLDGTAIGMFNGDREMFSFAVDAVVRF